MPDELVLGETVVVDGVTYRVTDVKEIPLADGAISRAVTLERVEEELEE